MNSIATLARKRSTYAIGAALLFVVGGLLFFAPVSGVGLDMRSLTLSDGTPGVVATYRLGFTIPSPELLGSIKIEFCANDPILTDPCTLPSGMDVSQAVLSDQTGATGFSIASGTNTNTIVITRAPASIAAPTPSTFTFTNITSPSSAGSYYGRIQTFAGSDTAAPENEHAGLAFSINTGVQLSAKVPPYLLFCGGITITNFDCSTASGDYVNFGNLTSAVTSSAQTQLLAATNGEGGYQIQIYGSTMTSGNNIISPMTIRDVSKPGMSEFGINLAANQTPQVGADAQGPGSASVASGYDQPNWFQFNSGNVIAGVATADSYRQFTVSYIVNIPTGQTPGVYVATLTYVCLANF